MSRLVYSCNPSKTSDTIGFTTNDVILFRSFTRWRYGEHERIDKNEVIRNMLFHPHHRSVRDIWMKAEECLKLAESEECRTYFERVARKYKEKFIYR